MRGMGEGDEEGEGDSGARKSDPLLSRDKAVPACALQQPSKQERAHQVLWQLSKGTNGES